MESLIVAAHSDPGKKSALLSALMAGHVTVIATWDDVRSKAITLQDFIHDGRPYIPVFSDEAEFILETKGSGFETKGVSIDANFLASLLHGDERLILNPRSAYPVELQAAELKAAVDPSRLPKS